MKPIERGEILGLGEYEADPRRASARASSRRRSARRVPLGDTCQRRLREPRHGAPADPGDAAHRAHHARGRRSLHEIETYNELVPGAARARRAPLFVEIADKATRDGVLVEPPGSRSTSRSRSTASVFRATAASRPTASRGPDDGRALPQGCRSRRRPPRRIAARQGEGGARRRPPAPTPRAPSSRPATLAKLAEDLARP